MVMSSQPQPGWRRSWWTGIPSIPSNREWSSRLIPQYSRLALPSAGRGTAQTLVVPAREPRQPATSAVKPFSATPCRRDRCPRHQGDAYPSSGARSTNPFSGGRPRRGPASSREGCSCRKIINRLFDRGSGEGAGHQPVRPVNALRQPRWKRGARIGPDELGGGRFIAGMGPGRALRRRQRPYVAAPRAGPGAAIQRGLSL